MVRGLVKLAHCGKVPVAKADDESYCQDTLGRKGVFTDSFELTLTSTVCCDMHTTTPLTHKVNTRIIFLKRR